MLRLNSPCLGWSPIRREFNGSGGGKISSNLIFPFKQHIPLDIHHSILELNNIDEQHYTFIICKPYNLKDCEDWY